MAITLKRAFALNDTPDLTSFVELKNQCKNTSYFTSQNPINNLSSWEGYYYYIGYNISSEASETSLPYTGGTITITYTITRLTSDDRSIYISGATPNITSLIGTIGNIVSTNDNGVGSFTVTIGQTIDARDELISISYEGETYNISIYQGSSDKVTGVSIKSISVSAGAIKAPYYYYASGETQTVTNQTNPSCVVTLTLNYSSGNTSTTTSYSSYGTLSGPTYSWSDDGKTYVDWSQTNASSLAVSMDDRTIYEGSKRYATISRTSSYTFKLNDEFGGASKSGSATCSCQIEQEANDVKSTSGGDITYSNVVAGDITNGWVPASGGSDTATATSGSQDWYKNAIVETYTSGSTYTIPAESGTDIIYASQSSLYGSGDDLGCNTKDETTLATATVVWQGSGGYSKSGTMKVVQEANKVVSTTPASYGSITGVYDVTEYIPASGGSATAIAPIGYQTYTTAINTYTSGCTSGGESDTKTVNPSPSSYTVSADSLGCTHKSSITKIGSKPVSYSSNGKTASCILTIYQDANDYNISYGDESCDTDWTYSTSVSGVSADDLPCDGGTSCPYGYSYSATAYYDEVCKTPEIWTYDSGCEQEIDGDETSDSGSVDMTSNASVDEVCVTAGENSSTSRSYVGDATVTVSYGGATDSDSASVYQDGCEPSCDPNDWGPWEYVGSGYYAGCGNLACNESRDVYWSGSTDCVRYNDCGTAEYGDLEVEEGSIDYNSESMWSSDPIVFNAYLPNGDLYDSCSVTLDEWTC